MDADTVRTIVGILGLYKFLHACSICIFIDLVINSWMLFLFVQEMSFHSACSFPLCNSFYSLHLKILLIIIKINIQRILFINIFILYFACIFYTMQAYILRNMEGKIGQRIQAWPLHCHIIQLFDVVSLWHAIRASGQPPRHHHQWHWISHWGVLHHCLHHLLHWKETCTYYYCCCCYDY